MMLTCVFSVVEDVDYLSDSDWDYLIDHHLANQYTKKRVSQLDEGILETCLVLRESDERLKLRAVCLGNKKDLLLSAFSKRLLALGYEVDCLSQADVGRYQMAYFEETFFSYLQPVFPDSLIFPSESDVFGFNQLPYLVAQRFDIPLVSGVTDFRLLKDKKFEVTRDISGGSERLVVKSPVILVVKGLSMTYLRMPTLKERLALKAKSANWFEPISGTSQVPEITLRKKEANQRLVRQLAGSDNLGISALMEELSESLGKGATT